MFFSRPAPSSKILMVCMGNVCRSPIAQFIAQSLASQAGLADSLLVDSAGTHAVRGGAPIDPRARALLTQRGYQVGKRRARQVADKDFERFDMILAMDQSNMSDLRGLCPTEHTHKLRLFLEFAPDIELRDVPDPYYGNLQGFERVVELCEAGARGLVAHFMTSPR